MISNLVLIGCMVFIAFLSRVVFDAFVIHKRLRLACTIKLLSIALLTNILAVIIISAVSLPFINHSWAIFMIQILFLMGIEAPMYQLFYRTKSWYAFAMSLLLARLCLALIVIVIGIVAMQCIGF